MEVSLIDDPRHTLEHLIRFATPSHVSNEKIIDSIADRLGSEGFTLDRVHSFDRHGVLKHNLVARRDPARASRTAGPGFVFFAHTDVVPADTWEGPGGAFDPAICDGRMYGRGACDMKGPLAAMLAAIRQLAREEQTAPLWIVCTADEEIGFGGAKTVRAQSREYREIVAAQPPGIIGEPTGLQVVHAHKGIVGCKLASHGRAAHSSTNEGLNANLAMVPLLSEMLVIERLTREDPALRDPRFDPPTLSWNFGFSDGASAINVTPAISRAWCSLRPMPSVDGLPLIEQIRHKAQQHGVAFELYEGGEPLWIDPDHRWVRQMCQLAAVEAPQTASYCTDGGQFSEVQSLVVCGPGHIAQAHTTDEYIELDQLHRGVELYQRVLRATCVA